MELCGIRTVAEWVETAEDAALLKDWGVDLMQGRLFGMAELTPSDIDVVQLYENFSAQGVASLIDHGFCTYENVAEVLRYENLIAPSGGLPVNTSGGNLAHGFIHGFVTAVEAIRCLRGESPNPVPGARTSLLAGGPGAPTVSSAIFGVD